MPLRPCAAASRNDPSLAAAELALHVEKAALSTGEAWGPSVFVLELQVLIFHEFHLIPLIPPSRLETLSIHLQIWPYMCRLRLSG